MHRRRREDAPAMAREDAPGYEGRGVVAASSAGVFFGSAFVFTFAVLLKPLAEEFSWSREAVSSAYASMTLAAAAAAPLTGHMVDRFGLQSISGPCLLLAACAFASLAVLTANLWHLFAVFAAIGFVGTGTSSIAYSRAVTSWFDRRRGVALALVISSSGLGAVVHPSAMQALVALVGWRGACLAVGAVIAAVGVPIVLRFVRERASGSHARTAAPGHAVGEALRSRLFWTLIVVVFGSTIAMNGAIVHLSALLTDRGVPAAHAALAVSAMGAASLAGRLTTGWLLDRFAATRVSFVLLTIAALGTFLLSDARSPGMGVFAAGLIGFGAGGELDVTPYLLSRYFGLRSLSTLFGFNWTAWGLAGALGPVLLGRAFDSTGSYELVFLQFAAATLAVAALMLTLPAPESARTRPSPRVERT